MSKQSVREPLQDRSRQKLEAIYAASVELLAEGGWDAVTVGEVERRSGVTRGTFYLRFPTRDALIDYVLERILDEVQAHQEHTFSGIVDGPALGIREAVDIAVRAMSEIFTVHGRVMMHGALGGTPENRLAAVTALGRAVASVLARAIGDTPKAKRAGQFAIELTFAALVAHQRPKPTFVEHGGFDDEEFISRLIDTITASLRSISAD